MKKFYLRLFYLFIATSLATIAVIYLIFQNLNYKIEKTIQSGWFPPSLEYYSAPIKIDKYYPAKNLKEDLKLRNYIEQSSLQKLKLGEFIELSSSKCKKEKCILWLNKKFPHEKNMVEYDGKNIKFYQNSSLKEVPFILLDPLLLAQKEGELIHFRKRLELNEVPYLCLQSITTSEDEDFVLHQGVSIMGIARAMIRNILKGRIAQGGSTITQQLIKNRFLNSEKTFRRKWTELLMSLILERKLTKDQILELYLNTVYMGGTGSYSLYGFASASQYYFNKPMNRINLSECALLTALLPSPGRLNPFSSPKKARVKRNVILRKMHKQKIISKERLDREMNRPLPVKRNTLRSQKASYFVHAVHKELQKLGIDWKDDLKIYTTMDLKIHQLARRYLQSTVKQLRKEKKLEGALISIDLETNKVRALIGGRDFAQSPFNRAIEAKRPIGSLVKPWTYLASLVHKNTNPLTTAQDEPLKMKKWSPKNYDDKYFGTVPLYFSLKQSLNAASIEVGLNAGLKNILLTFKELGLESKVEPLPSITLGALDLSLLEVVQMYSTIARMGSYQKLSFINRIENVDGEVLYQSSPQSEQMFPKEKVAVLIGMMKQVIESGTAKWIKPFWKHPSAGKTGTSNEERDSWFVGFTPQTLTGVWMGYDDNTPHNLTGSSGALVAWMRFMGKLNHSSEEFKWPKFIKKEMVTLPEVKKTYNDKKLQFFELKEPSSKKGSSIDLIFESDKKWYQFF